MDLENYDWPGWRLKDNPFGKEFDLEARKRMVKNSELLILFIKKYFLKGIILEVGPFFNPLITIDRFPQTKKIIYLDNDPYVIDYLKIKYSDEQIEIIKTEADDFKLNLISEPVENIVISHLLNYIDYQKFLDKIEKIILPGGLLFLNHSVNYGLPFFFSAKRPKNIEEIMRIITKKFEIVEIKIIPTDNPEHQPNERLLLVARKACA